MQSRCAEVVQRWCRGAEVQRWSNGVCVKVQLQSCRCRGAEVQRCRGAEVQSEVLRC